MLTEEERCIVNRAMDIIMKKQAYGASSQLCFSHYERCTESWDLCYFDSARTQHNDIPGATLSDKLNACYEIEANMPSIEELRAEKIEKLRAQLAALEGDGA